MKSISKILPLLALLIASPNGFAIDPQVTCIKGEQAGQKINAPGNCKRYFYNLNDKYGDCDANCDITERWPDWSADVAASAAVTGKRIQAVRNVPSYDATRFYAKSGCSSNNEGQARSDCYNTAAAWTTGATPNSMQRKAFCPDADKAEFREQNVIVSDTCGQYDPTIKCAAYRPYRDCGGSFDFTQCSNSPLDPDDEYCCGPQYTTDQQAYQACYDQYAPQYNQCMNTLITGPTDCYCKQTTTPSYFKFDTTVGAWKCKPCRDAYPEKFVEDPTTGTSCKAPCVSPQFWDPSSSTCIASCGQGTEQVIIGSSRECLPLCALNEKRIGRDCVRKCPSGMDISTDGFTCECAASNFTAATRLPVVAGGSSVTNAYSVWNLANTIQADGTATNAYACACAQPGSPTQVSQIDSIEAIMDIARPPYGLVPTISSVTAGVNTYTCGCPNFNEKFVGNAGRFQCMPRVTPASGTAGVVLADVPANSPITTAAERTAIGIIDSISDNVTLRSTMLRSGTTTADLAVGYTRRVWKCLDGYKLDPLTNQCRRKDASSADILADACSDATPVRSSDFVSDLAIRADFSRLTNRNLACCLGVKANPLVDAKYHCLATDAAAYPSFDEFYDAGGGGGQDWNSLSFPNRFYLRAANNRALPGVYRKDGTRCSVLDTLPPTAQMAALSTIVSNVNADRTLNPFRNIAGITANLRDQEACVFVMRTAIEMTCAANPLDATQPLSALAFPATSADYRYTASDGLPVNTVRRCFQPASIRVHYSLEDMSQPTKTSRVIFRKISSIGTTGTEEMASSIDVKRLIQGN